jgi:sugar phosphate isomerase/epimerase
MKYAICNETFGDWPHDRAFAYARAAGYDGVEIAPFTLGADAHSIGEPTKAEIRRIAAAEGVEVVGLHWLLARTQGYYLTSPDEALQQRTGEYLAELARLCRDLGGHLMVLGSPQQRNLLPGITHFQALEYAARTIGYAVPEFERCEVTLAVEPLGPAEGDFLLTAAAGEELLDLVGSPKCGLHLDVKAMSTESEPIERIVKRHADRLVHFHANDPNRQGPGMGDVDFVPILAALQEIGYDDWVSVEPFDYSAGVDALVRGSREYLAKCEAAARSLR